MYDFISVLHPEFSEYWVILAFLCDVGSELILRESDVPS